VTLRSPHEARWSLPDVDVKHRRSRNRGWVLIPLFAVIAVVATLAYDRFMSFATVSYEVRHCEQPLTADSTWEQVQSAGCEPVPADRAEILVVQDQDRRSPDDVQGSISSFDDIPVNSPVPSILVTTDEPAASVVLVEPENERIRRELSRNAPGTQWSGNVGSRGPLSYQVLITPAAATP
jgi:hypothetical protein